MIITHDEILMEGNGIGEWFAWACLVRHDEWLAEMFDRGYYTNGEFNESKETTADRGGNEAGTGAPALARHEG
jgi:hypothetical protein